MSQTTKTPATMTETPREQYLSECLTERREVLAATRKELAATQAKLDALVEAAKAAEAGIAEHVARAAADGVSPNFGVLGVHRDALLAFVQAAKGGAL